MQLPYSFSDRKSKLVMYPICNNFCEYSFSRNVKKCRLDIYPNLQHSLGNSSGPLNNWNVSIQIFAQFARFQTSVDRTVNVYIMLLSQSLMTMAGAFFNLTKEPNLWCGCKCHT